MSKKKLLMVSIIAIGLLSGCNQSEELVKEKDAKISQLEQKIKELEIENSELKMENAQTSKKLQTLLKERGKSSQ
ncbi:hypothetical protein [Niallia sp. Krafla_26]|uniref:hypothetical protein n=1 Tax=Niallia sp. Krafla_26 TaxID=3064703 RepID=UPI003D17A137